MDATRVVLRLIDKGAAVLIAGIYGGTLVGIAYFLMKSIEHLSGETTAILISYLSDTPCGITVTVSVGVGTLGVAYGLRQHRLHRRTIEHFAPRLAKYEHQVDPNRSTSGLTKEGDTNPDDL
jgi:hypothetical protein